MKKVYLLNLIFAFGLLVLCASSAEAQSETAPDAKAQDAKTNQERRDDFLQELGLTDEQMRQFRRVNAETRPALRAAQQRLREANRALDEAVYADAPDEAAIGARIKEAQSAQAEVIKLRTLSEFAVRRILTAEQLTKFREARRRFQAAAQKKLADQKETRMLNRQNGGAGAANGAAKLVNRRQQLRRQRVNAAPND